MSGAGFGAEETFDAEHVGMDLLPLIGFAPTHDVGVVAMCNGQVDHAVTALLAAEVMDIVGGVAGVETRREQVSVVGGLPGGDRSDDRPVADHVRVLGAPASVGGSSGIPSAQVGRAVRRVRPCPR